MSTAKLGIGVEALGQPAQVVLVAAEVAADDAQLRIAGKNPVAGRQDVFLDGRPGLAEHVPLGVGRVVSQLGVLGVERQPGAVRLGEVGHERSVRLSESPRRPAEERDRPAEGTRPTCP